MIRVEVQLRGKRLRQEFGIGAAGPVTDFVFDRCYQPASLTEIAGIDGLLAVREPSMFLAVSFDLGMVSDCAHLWNHSDHIPRLLSLDDSFVTVLGDQTVLFEEVNGSGDTPGRDCDVRGHLRVVQK